MIKMEEGKEKCSFSLDGCCSSRPALDVWVQVTVSLPFSMFAVCFMSK